MDRAWTVSMWSAAASTATLMIADRERPSDVVSSAPMTRDRRATDVWTVTIAASSIGDADLYGFRVTGPTRRFDPAKLLLDPEATEVWFPPGHDRGTARIHGADTFGRSPFGVLPLAAPAARRAAPLSLGTGRRREVDELIIYEIHVRGATMREPGLEPSLRGTFAGLTLHAPRLASLGVTAVELLPVHQFDPTEGNYWGYMPLAWNALHGGYVAAPASTRCGSADVEFSAMVDAFHAVDIEVILDVVYNHTTEEDEFGPTFHLRGIDDDAYYVVYDDGSYDDDAGCGNVVRAAHPAAAKLILDSLARFADLGVDGFRFDLGSLLGRDLRGRVQRDSSLIDAITAFAAARDLRLITEPWDLAAYQIGDSFPGRTWAQWNGKFRDDCRAFLRAENGATAAFAQRIVGSPDLYSEEPGRSINFITAHDGFTLYDLVSYEHKHNDVNGHGGRDGTEDNRSWNCGWEGDDTPADQAADVQRLRIQQMKNAFVLLMLSDGVPMMLAGDEFAQTQHGNNNPYNQDNAITWLDWSRATQFAELTAFVRDVIALRRSNRGPAVLHGVDAEPDLADTSHSIAWQRGDLYVMANAWWEPLTFTVHPDAADGGGNVGGDGGDGWTLVLASADPIAPLAGNVITLAPRSTVVLRRG